MNDGRIPGRVRGNQREVKGSSRTTTAIVASIREDSQQTKRPEEAASSIKTHDDLGLSRQLASHILLVSNKSNVKLSKGLKRTICKRCTSVLIAGQTAQTRMENKSRGGRKPWADVLVNTCMACGMEKRYPVGAKQRIQQRESDANG